MDLRVIRVVLVVPPAVRVSADLIHVVVVDSIQVFLVEGPGIRIQGLGYLRFLEHLVNGVFLENLPAAICWLEPGRSWPRVDFHASTVLDHLLVLGFKPCLSFFFACKVCFQDLR